MAKWSLNIVTFIPNTGAADAVTVGTSGYVSLAGGSTTQYIKVYEMEEQGQGSAAGAANWMLWARATTLTASASILATPNSIGPLDANTAAVTAPAVGNIAAASGPYRSANTAFAKLNMSFNAFGGILRWQAAPGCEWGQVGSTAPNGESFLSNFSGGAVVAQSAKVLFEII